MALRPVPDPRVGMRGRTIPGAASRQPSQPDLDSRTFPALLSDAPRPFCRARDRRTISGNDSESCRRRPHQGDRAISYKDFLMRRFLALALLASAGVPALAADAPLLKLRPVPFTDVQIHDSFWSPRQEVNRTASIPAELRDAREVGQPQEPGAGRGQGHQRVHRAGLHGLGRLQGARGRLVLAGHAPRSRRWRSGSTRSSPSSPRRSSPTAISTAITPSRSRAGAGPTCATTTSSTAPGT